MKNNRKVKYSVIETVERIVSRFKEEEDYLLSHGWKRWDNDDSYWKFNGQIYTLTNALEIQTMMDKLSVKDNAIKSFGTTEEHQKVADYIKKHLEKEDKI